MIDSVFLHVPKAAGTSVKAMLFRHYSRAKTVRAWQVQSGGDVSPADFGEYQIDVDSIVHVSGHVSADRFRSNQALLDDFDRCGRFVLPVTRDPLERLVSDYNYIRRTQGHPRAAAAERPLEDFIGGSPANEQASFLDVEGVDLNAGTLLFKRPDRLTERLIILDSSRVDDDLPALEFAAFGKTGPVSRKNATLVTTASELPDDIVNEFNSRNALDIQLVEYAKAFARRDLQVRFDAA
jgi:hypothetical protein